MFGDIRDLEVGYGADKTLTSDGVWYYPPLPDEVEARREKEGLPRMGFLLTHQSIHTNRLWAARSSKLYRENQDKFDRGYGLTDPKILRQTLCDFCEVIVRDWTGFLDKNKKEIPFSPKALICLLEKLPSLYDLLNKKSRDNANFQQQEKRKDELLGKSASISTGS